MQLSELKSWLDEIREAMNYKVDISEPVGAFTSLPNFDAEIFFEITGVKIN